jgi:Uma2 family endonuclease
VSVATRISAEEFHSLPDPEGNFFDTHELHDGNLVEVPGPTGEHVLIQERCEASLRVLLPNKTYDVLREFYYTMPGQARRADVAVVLRTRREAQRKQVFFGAPEIIIEILSDSNRATDLGRLRRECLADSCQEFWIVDPSDQVVEVYGRTGEFHQYGVDTVAKLHLDGNEYQMAVRRIFVDSR